MGPGLAAGSSWAARGGAGRGRRSPLVAACAAASQQHCGAIRIIATIFSSRKLFEFSIDAHTRPDKTRYVCSREWLLLLQMATAVEDWDAALSAWDALEAECEAEPTLPAVEKVAAAAPSPHAATDGEDGVAPAAAAAVALTTAAVGRKRARAVALEAVARRKSRASGAARGRGRTFTSEWARLLATGPRAGCELRGDDGMPLRSVANLGLAKGARAELEAAATCRGFAVRALETAAPLLSHQTVARALQELTSGGDLHRANKILQHDDVTTVRVVVALWFVEFKLPVPAAFVVDAQRRAELSTRAQRRLRQRRGDLLAFRFIIESAGCFTSTLAPLVPPQWIGREFDSGKDMHDALVQTADPGADIPLLASYGLRLADDASWMDRGALQRCVTARQVSPLAVVRLRYNASRGVTQVAFKKYEPTALDTAADRADGTLARVVTGCLLESTVAAAVVLEVPTELLPHLKQGAAKAAAAECTPSLGSNRPAFGTPSAAARCLLEPAAQLQTSIRRGRGLCTEDTVRKAVKELLQAGSYPVAELGYARTSGTRTLLWRLIGCIFQDVCPYKAAGDSQYCSVSELVGLAALAHADHEFRLPPKLAERVMVTAIRLHAYDGPGCVWPWRGWSKLGQSADPAGFELTGSSGAQLRDAIRAAMATLPMASGDKAVLLRQLGALKEGSQWIHKLRPLCDLSSVDPVPYSAAEGAVLDTEARLASLDHISRPNILLFVQGCLPWVPQEESQHSLAALAELIWRLSSSVNVRTIRQRSAGMSFDEELFRITSFVDKAAETEEQQLAKRMALERYDPMRVDGLTEVTKWQSAFETMHLTPHEKLMVKVITSVQKHLGREGQPSSVQKQSGEESISSETCGAAVTATESRRVAEPASAPTSGGTVSGVSAGRGRPPTKFESRTCFLQLFGMRHDFSIPSDAGVGQIVSVTVAGTAEMPVLVQKVGLDGSSSQVQQAEGLYDKAVDALVAHHKLGQELSPLPLCCPGFAWSCASRAVVTVRFVAVGSRTLEFLVDGMAIAPFDATQLMLPANAPEVVSVRNYPRVEELLRQVLYSTEAPLETKYTEDPMRLLTAVRRRSLACSGAVITRSLTGLSWDDSSRSPSGATCS